MPVIVNGSTGITTPASNTTGTQTVTTLSSPAATALTIQSGGTTAMTVSTGQNVGIGTVSPSEKLDVAGAIRSSGSTNPYFVLSDGTNNGYMQLAGSVFNFYTAQSIPMTFSVAGTERMRIDANGNMGIGTTSPSTRLQTSTTSDGAQAIFVGAQSTNEQTLLFRNQYYTNNLTAGVAAIGWIDTGSSGGILTFKTGTNGGGTTNIPTERMRIDSSGNFLVGRTTSSFSNTGTVLFTGGYAQIENTASDNLSLRRANGGVEIAFYTGTSTLSGTVSCSGSSTAYNTSSDYRLKNSVAPMTTGLATVSALKPVTYKWNADDSDGEGFIAHELQSVIPHAVTGEKDAVNEDGSIRPQGVDYSKIVVHLVAAIKELSAKNDALEAINAAFEVRLAALEAK